MLCCARQRHGFVERQIIPNHACRGEVAFSTLAALAGTDLRGVENCLRHLLRRVHEKPGATVFNNFRKRATSKSYDGGAARQGFHGHQRTGFVDKARHEQTTCSGQEVVLTLMSNCPNEAMLPCQSWLDHPFEILLMRFVSEDLT